MINHTLNNICYPIRVDKYIIKNFNLNLTHSLLEKYFRLGLIKVNNKKIKSNFRLSTGDSINIFSKLFNHSNDSDNIKFDHKVKQLANKILHDLIVYEDLNFIAINKPPNLAVQGGSKISISINDALLYLNTQYGSDYKLVHRLDKDTSGLLLLAKNTYSAWKLTKAFHEQLIMKKYYAICSYNPNKKNGIISNFIIKNNKNLYCSEKEDLTNHAKLAITKYQVIENYNSSTLIEFIPKTGRTHQIRLHALYIKCPIIGDKKYNIYYNKSVDNYLLLHAKEISLPKLIFGKDILIKSDLPKYFY